MGLCLNFQVPQHYTAGNCTQKFSTQLCNYPLLVLPTLVLWKNFTESEHQTRDVRKVSVHFEHLGNPSHELGSQSEETLLHIHEQSLSCGASQSAVRRR
jgi:hypothetical protein